MLAFALGLTLLLNYEPDPLDDLWRFPSRPAVKSQREFALLHLGWLRANADMGQSWAFECHGWCEDARWCYRAWDALDDAQGAYCKDWRRERMQHLRKMIGDEAYFRGSMPPPVPVWRFSRIN